MSAVIEEPSTCSVTAGCNTNGSSFGSSVGGSATGSVELAVDDAVSRVQELRRRCRSRFRAGRHRGTFITFASGLRAGGVLARVRRCFRRGLGSQHTSLLLSRCRRLGFLGRLFGRWRLNFLCSRLFRPARSRLAIGDHLLGCWRGFRLPFCLGADDNDRENQKAKTDCNCRWYAEAHTHIVPRCRDARGRLWISTALDPISPSLFLNEIVLIGIIEVMQQRLDEIGDARLKHRDRRTQIRFQ